VNRRIPPCRPAWWLHELPRPTGPVHWHVSERWTCRGFAESEGEAEVVASTEGIAWRVLTGRTGRLMLDDWSLDAGTASLDEVVLHHGSERVELRIRRCECAGCGTSRS
jgi:hypothetical protein